LTGGGDLVLVFILLTGCVIGAALRIAAGRGVAGGPAVGPRRLESVEDATDVRSGSDCAGWMRDEGPARLADIAPGC